MRPKQLERSGRLGLGLGRLGGLAGAAALLTATLLVVGGGAVSSSASANSPRATSPAPAEALPATTTTLPLFGAPLTIDVTSAPGGAIASVSIDPADGLTASTVKPGKVRFVNEDGTAKVQVSARGGGQKVQARAGQLSDILGPGSWSGDLWGTGTPTVVDFEIVATPAGGPDIVNVQSSDPTAEISPVSYRDWGNDWGDSHRARVTIRFSNGVEQRWLGITAAVGVKHGESRATLSVGLSDATGERRPAADVIGARVWTGTLCDGTAAQVDYTVDADGSVSDVSATPDTAFIGDGHKGTFVAFSDHEVVKIRVKRSDDGATFRIDAAEWFRCDNPDPTVNTPIDETLDDHLGDDRHGDDRHGWPSWDGNGGLPAWGVHGGFDGPDGDGGLDDHDGHDGQWGDGQWGDGQWGDGDGHDGWRG